MDWRRAVEPIKERHFARAQRILSTYPDYGIAMWAYQHLIERFGWQVLLSQNQDITKTEGLIEELSILVENYLGYGSKEQTSIEPFEGHFNFIGVQSVDFLIRAVDALVPKGRTAQSELLLKIPEMFPENEEVANYAYKFSSFKEPFELTFTDLMNGGHIDTRDYLSKVVIVDFWATWCQPCLAFVPHLKNTLSRFPDDVQIVGISIDDRELPDQAACEQRKELESQVVYCASKHGMDWPICLDY